MGKCVNVTTCLGKPDNEYINIYFFINNKKTKYARERVLQKEKFGHLKGKHRVSN